MNHFMLAFIPEADKQRAIVLFSGMDLNLSFEPDLHFNGDLNKKSVAAKKESFHETENRSLDVELNYDRIFRLVKKNVREHLGKERSGLGLALSDLPPTLGAYWQVGGNYIVMNENLVKAMARIAKSAAEFNSYVYVILTHEYVHSLGYIDEMEARKVTAEVVKAAFGTEHFAYRMSAGDLWTLYPMLKYVPGGNGSTFRIVDTFDSSSTSYIG